MLAEGALIMLTPSPIWRVLGLVGLTRRPRTLALVGKSGTGKSHKAQAVAQRFGVDLIIDDGLLIRGQNILAGRSAKREKGILSAIKTAVFANPDQIAEVKKALAQQAYGRILVIGTSVKMIMRIARQLDLLPIHRIIRIEQVSTRQEIESALRVRAEQGKHIIPVPAVAVKRSYPHIFFESVKTLLKGRKGIRRTEEKVVEKTVVRPEYGRARAAVPDKGKTV
jgi:ABC-type dipeptide/oligopeptide/nickel transport system ATPase component